MPMGNSNEYSRFLGGDTRQDNTFLNSLPNFEPKASTFKVEGELVDEFWR